MASITPNDVHNFLQHLKPIYDPLPRRTSSRRAHWNTTSDESVSNQDTASNKPRGKHGGIWTEVKDPLILSQYKSTYEKGFFEYLPHTADIQIHSCKYKRNRFKDSFTINSNVINFRIFLSILI